ncbi:peptidoglycan-binding protein [Mesorhizobium sp. M0340]|uniref:peptidoglycan-binding domain-containing protein n=1 Tax=Mesorhizobium sp. M0340 TaxID=2956939 RepID=UPI00333A436B
MIKANVKKARILVPSGWSKLTGTIGVRKLVVQSGRGSDCRPYRYIPGSIRDHKRKIPAPHARTAGPIERDAGLGLPGARGPPGNLRRLPAMRPPTHYPPAASVYQAPAPVYQEPAPTYRTPTVTQPAPAPLVVLPGTAARFKEIVLQVQFAMLAFGYYNGELDGKMSPEMRSGLVKMQSDYNLKVTGTITPETLNALRITAD